MGPSCISSREASPVNSRGNTACKGCGAGHLALYGNTLNEDVTDTWQVFSCFTTDSCGNIPFFRVVDPSRILFFIVSMFVYIYAVPLQGMDRDNGEGAEVAIPCPVDKRIIPYFAIGIKAKALKNGAKASLYPRPKGRGYRAKVEFDK